MLVVGGNRGCRVKGIGSATAVLVLVQAMLFLPLDVRATDQVQVDYMLNCQGCHLPGGEGMPLRGVPRATDHLGKFLHVKGGREFLIQVPGAALSDLDDERLANVVNWMLVNFSKEQLPRDFKPYSASEVNALRANALTEIGVTRAALIEEIERGYDTGEVQ